jgi:hypothetical protein
VGNVSQRLLSKYIFKAAEKEEVKPELFDKIFEYELDVINKFNEPRDERDAAVQNRNDTIVQSVNRTIH